MPGVFVNERKTLTLWINEEDGFQSVWLRGHMRLSHVVFACRSTCLSMSWFFAGAPQSNFSETGW